MLDKARNNLIKHAFQLAGITCPESEPTAAEIDDAAHVLNVMLQSWNNDGFRLFKIKRGYMPFIKNRNEYSLATEAYKSFSRANINYFSQIGADTIPLNTISNAAPRQKLVAVSDVVSSPVLIEKVNYDETSVDLEQPLDIELLVNDAIFYGTSFETCATDIKTEDATFNTLTFKNADVMPAVGNTVFFEYNNTWQSAQISLVDTANGRITINRSLTAGSITNGFLAYGTSFYYARSTQTIPLAYRRLELDHVPADTVRLAIQHDGIMDKFIDVDYIDGNVIITKEALSIDELKALGWLYLQAENVKDPIVQVSWRDLLGIIPVTELDWGSVTDTSNVQTDDWGFVTDPAVNLEDWGTLTSTASLKSFASTIDDVRKYVVATDSDLGTDYLFYKDGSADWVSVDVSGSSLQNFKLIGFGDNVYLYDEVQGIFKLNGSTLEQVYALSGAETVVQYNNFYYFISPIISGTTRRITSTADFENFEEYWEVDLATVGFPAVYDDKLYIGSPQTFVTNDMHTFTDINVYSEGRSVVGTRILNLNYTQYCSFSMDGVHFLPMPLMFSTQSAWGYVDGCTFVAVYGTVLEDGTIGTQIYTTNDFNPVWLPKTQVSGRVKDIFFRNSKAYFVSDVEVKSMTYYNDVAVEELQTYLFGEQIGRPQEIMNVMKYSLDTTMQLPMNALALRDFLLLPNEKTNGEPVNYCFMREAEDGKMMIWGTPDKFGEYLRFSYVEPLTLLEDARSTPDFPDEYYEAVEDGLAAELAYHYQLPVDRIQALVAKAQASKENAMLHDNEDTSYDIMPNQRML